MTVEVTFEIEPPERAEADTGAEKTTLIAARLVAMGGHMVIWWPEMNGAPARATFRFDDEPSRERFVADALTVHGVSLLR